ncbi:MAG: DUF4330 family protein [Clostridia bacterium]|nr:DUF4330 family protein [Clostridia bacterium]
MAILNPKQKSGDEGSRKRVRFNILDVLIILGVVLFIMGVLWREELTAVTEQQDKENTVTVICEVYAEGADLSALQALPMGETELMYGDGAVGTVVWQLGVPDVEVESTLGGKEPVPSEKPLVSLRLSAVAEDSGYFIHGDKLFIGSTYHFYTDKYEFDLQIKSIVEE